MTESEIAKDYADASNYVTDYFSIKDALIEDYGDAQKTAIFNFFLYANLKEEKVDFDIFSVLLDLTIALLPTIGFVKSGVDKFVKHAKKKINYDILDELDKAKIELAAGIFFSKAAEKAKDATKSLVKGGDSSVNESAIVHLAAKAMEDSTALKAFLRNSIIYEREVYRNLLSLIFDANQNQRGKLKDFALLSLNKKPTYDSREIIYFGKLFELNLYEKFYANKAYVKEVKRIGGFGDVSEIAQVEGLPKKVTERILEIRNLPHIFYAVGDWHLKRVKTQKTNLSPG